jgi:hypothetical protein
MWNYANYFDFPTQLHERSRRERDEDDPIETLRPEFRDWFLNSLYNAAKSKSAGNISASNNIISQDDPHAMDVINNSMKIFEAQSEHYEENKSDLSRNPHEVDLKNSIATKYSSGSMEFTQPEWDLIINPYARERTQGFLFSDQTEILTDDLKTYGVDMVAGYKIRDLRYEKDVPPYPLYDINAVDAMFRETFANNATAEEPEEEPANIPADIPAEIPENLALKTKSKVKDLTQFSPSKMNNDWGDYKDIFKTHANEPEITLLNDLFNNITTELIKFKEVDLDKPEAVALHNKIKDLKRVAELVRIYDHKIDEFNSYGYVEGSTKENKRIENENAKEGLLELIADMKNDVFPTAKFILSSSEISNLWYGRQSRKKKSNRK